MELKQVIAEMTEQFKNEENSAKESTQIRILSIAVPEEYKEKFDELQYLSGRRFGKLLQEIIKKSIDAVI